MKTKTKWWEDNGKSKAEAIFSDSIRFDSIPTFTTNYYLKKTT